MGSATLTTSLSEVKTSPEGEPGVKKDAIENILHLLKDSKSCFIVLYCHYNYLRCNITTSMLSRCLVDVKELFWF